MQVILKEDIEKLGAMGDMVEVKRGYARNYLIPRDLAVEATPKNVKQLEHQKRVVAAKIAKVRQDSETIAEKLEGSSVTLYHRAGEEEKLFGSVTTMEIADALKEQGIEVDRRKISLEEPIKRLGEYEAKVKLPGGVSTAIKVSVLPVETEEAPAPEKAEAPAPEQPAEESSAEQPQEAPEEDKPEQA